MGDDEKNINRELADFEFARRVEREKSPPVLAKSLSQLPVVWAAVRDVLGFSGLEAVWFVNDRIVEMKPPLYTDEGHTNDLPRSYLLGWEKGFADGSSLNFRQIREASESNFANYWGNDKPEYMETLMEADECKPLHLYLAPPDATAIVEAAKAIAGAKPLSLNGMTADTDRLQSYPVELRAAIEAFEAVSRDPAAMKGKTAKGALLAWLEANRPDIESKDARERIAMVANWQPKGGAPKTPG